MNHKLRAALSLHPRCVTHPTFPGVLQQQLLCCSTEMGAWCLEHAHMGTKRAQPPNPKIHNGPQEAALNIASSQTPQTHPPLPIPGSKAICAQGTARCRSAKRDTSARNSPLPKEPKGPELQKVHSSRARNTH